MGPQQKIILRDIGLLIHVPGLMALVSLPIALALAEGYAARAFAWTGLISLGLGQALYRLFQSPEETRLHHGMVVAALGWIVVPLLGSLPFLLIASHLAVLPQTPETVRV
ncbi:MAG: TrkH family potassium uptake protein, partial [Nitrospinota bacterium]